jgi:hypothetical protein
MNNFTNNPIHLGIILYFLSQKKRPGLAKSLIYLPCPRYFFGFCSLGPNLFLCLPVLFLPKEIFLDISDDFDFAIPTSS